MDPGQTRGGDISRRSDKFGLDYVAVTFIFIEILHSNDQPYFSIGAEDFALPSCFSPFRFLLPFGESGRAIRGARGGPILPDRYRSLNVREMGEGRGKKTLERGRVQRTLYR